MGVVFEAVERDRGARVALKMLHAFEPEMLIRLKNEFRALHDIQHPNVVTLGELAREGDTWFFTMELVEGVDLVTYVCGERSPPEAREHNAIVTRPSHECPPGEPRGEALEERSRSTFDEAKLRSSFVQLAGAIRALHAAEKVHRDVKPSNVLVTREGRVVLLDFGVIMDAALPDREEGIVGTIAYMAPEQATGESVGAPADWYALGVVLYECLTGRVPFVGTGVSVIEEKVLRDPPRASVVAPGVPEDLDRLCAELLDPDPARRPTGAAVMHRLAGASDERSPSLSSSQSDDAPPQAPFVGRAGELAILDDAFARVRSGETVAVIVEGESGIGKSALVREFIARTADTHDDVLVLRGRCHEREAVPFKALDGVMDALCAHLAPLDDADVASIVPGNAALLAQAFPALRKLAPFDLAARRPRAEGGEQRVLLFATVRELFTRLAEMYTLVVAIDDLHWAETDSLTLLAELLGPPLAPRMLLLGTARPGSRAPAALPAATTIGLERLPTGEAIELASRLLDDFDPELAAAIAKEAEGHPLFVDELVRHSRNRDGPALRAHVHLDDALVARVARLEPHERALLEALAVAGVSLPPDTAMRAAGLDFDSFRRGASALRAAHLARAGGTRGVSALEPYHDRVREAVVARLTDDARRAQHERLAVALEESEGSDPGAIATHWIEAGRDDRAAGYALSAAAQAYEALAYDRAAHLYARVLSLVGDDATKQAVRLRLAESLACTGRGKEAAAAFLDAAAHADAQVALDLRRHGAEELLIAGDIDAGAAVLRDVLARAELWMPTSRLALVVLLLAFRAIVRVRGLAYTLCEEADVPRAAKIKIDACWGVARAMSITDPLLGVYFQTRMLLLVLRWGEPFRLMYALGLEGAYLSVQGSSWRGRAEAAFERADRVSRRCSEPAAKAVAIGMRGFAAFVQGRMREGLELSDRAVKMIGESAPGMFWETRAAQMNALWSLSLMGQYGELSSRLDRFVREAVDRGDAMSIATLRAGSLFTAVWLRHDKPGEVRAAVTEAMRAWTRAAYHHQHHWEVGSLAQIDLYEGRGLDAHERFTRGFARARRALLLKMEVAHFDARRLRARTAILAAAQSQGAARRRLLRAAERDARWMLRAPPAYSAPWGDLVLACVAGVRGEVSRVAPLAERALDGFEATSQHMATAVAKRALGHARGGDDGRALIRAADEWMRGVGIVNPARMARMYAPGITGDA